MCVLKDICLRGFCLIGEERGLVSEAGANGKCGNSQLIERKGLREYG